MSTFRLALRLLARDWRAGELRVLVLALVIAVGSVTSVGFFTDRVNRALARQAAFLIGGDLSIVADHQLDVSFPLEAQKRGLQHNCVLSFPSMVQGQGVALAEIRVVSLGYPLRGKVEIDGRETAGIPPPGTVWLAPRLLSLLGVQVGEAVAVGDKRLIVAATLTREPDQAGSLFNIAPRLLLNLADLPATGLLREGSRVNYRLSLAGDEAAVAGYRAWAEKRLGRGERLESVADARPEIRNALSRAERFLGLSALTGMVLAAVAIALAVRRYVRRHLDNCAVMRCLGAAQGQMLRLFLAQFAVLGVAAAGAGALLGYAAQHLLAERLGVLLSLDLPGVSWLAAVPGMAAGLAVLFGVALPPLMQLKSVPALRVLRREIGLPRDSGLLVLAGGTAALAGLVLWQAGDAKLGGYVVAGLGGAAALAWLLAYVLLKLLARLPLEGRGAWRLGLANLLRRGLGSAVQAAAFGVGLTVLLLLSVVRGDLLESWQNALPADAPNRFVINIQPDQETPLRAFFGRHGLGDAALFPMVRGRLVAIGDRPVSAADYPTDERAQRLVEREFNLSWAAGAPLDNRIVAGRWWEPGASAQLSVEEGIAKTLGIALGDRLTYEVAGSRFSASVTSLRKVAWDSFRVNFFVIASPGVLENYPATRITAFYLPSGREALLDEMVREFPNFTVIDVAAVMNEVRRIMSQLAATLGFVFLFTWALGFVVLFAAIASTNDERVVEAALMRTLGASRRVVMTSQFAEFAGIGLLAGIVAAVWAGGLGWVLGSKIFQLPYVLNPWLFAVPLGGSLLVGTVGVLGSRGALTQPPLAVLRES